MDIAFDIGGTNMRIAAVLDGTLGDVRKIPTPQDPHEGIAAFAAIAKEIGDPIGKAFGDIAGSIGSDGRVLDAGHLLPWEGVKIEEEISRAIGAPTHVFNDCVLIGLGEARRGAGVGFPNVAYLTVSTGVGGALCGDTSRSRVLADDFATLKERLNDEISGTAIRKKFGIHPKDLDSLEERIKLADILAGGLEEIHVKWKPDVFVIGGSMIVGKNPIPLDRVREKFSIMPVKMAELGDNGGLVGGAILAEEK